MNSDVFGVWPMATNTPSTGIDFASPVRRFRIRIAVEHSRGRTITDEHIHLTASTDITLQVGASKIVMKSDGTITIQGVHIDVIGSSRIDLNK